MPRERSFSQIALAIALVVSLSSVARGEPISRSVEGAIESGIENPQRSPSFVARDSARHPAQELEFFGLRGDMSVVEIWPGGGYWTEILAPILRERGHYTLALPALEGGSAASLNRKLTENSALYGKITRTVAGKGHYDIAAPESVDLIVSFRNVHNWMADGYAPEMFSAFFKALKPGGILGIEEHRGQRSVDQDPRAADGYVRQDTIIAFAKTAGFVFEASSELNANPRDTANWPKGVWTLPPTLALDEQDKAKYVAIGEADNSVLKFRRP